MSSSPQPESKTGQYEFNAEQNRTFTELASAMGTVATLMKVIGLAFLIFFGLTLYKAIQSKTGYGPSIALGSATLLFLSIGLWTSGAAHSFQRIVESQNRDIWHLMNALSKLHSLYALMRTIIFGSMVLLVIALVLSAFEHFNAP